jgi:hypothetical protein
MNKIITLQRECILRYAHYFSKTIAQPFLFGKIPLKG